LQEVSSVLEGQFPISTPKDYLIEDAVFLGIKDVLSLYYDGLMQDVPLFRTLRRLGAADGCLKNNKKNSLYEELISIYQLPEIEINKVPAKNSSQMQVAFDNIARVFSSIQNCGLHIALRDITEKLYGFTEHMALHALYEMADERGIVTTRKLYQMMVDMTRYKSSERVGYYQNPDAISILTCHDAKGMEFQTVIIYGMEDFSANDEEEIRVLYVATSRAKDNLIMLETNRAKHYEAFENIAPYVKVVGRNGE
jgi:superfamily I DNA/RNA helicase